MLGETPAPRFYLCIEGLPDDTPVAGTFNGWGAFGYNDIQFVADDDTRYPVWLKGDDEA